MWVKRVVAGTLAVAALSVACAGDSADDADRTAANGSDAGPDGARNPVSIYDPGTADSGLYCALLVVAECDGPEDCASGEVCCGTLEAGVAVSYESMRCQPTCDGAAGGITMCHEHADCPDYVPDAGDAGDAQICRRSSVLPEYLLVCGVWNQFLPTEVAQPSTAADEINCGRDLVCAAGEKCCVTASWDAATKMNVPAPGYCAADDEECDCANVRQREY